MVKLNQSGYNKDVIKIEVPAGQKVKYDLVGAGASGGSGGSVATKGNDGSPGAAQITFL